MKLTDIAPPPIKCQNQVCSVNSGLRCVQTEPGWATSGTKVIRLWLCRECVRILEAL